MAERDFGDRATAAAAAAWRIIGIERSSRWSLCRRQWRRRVIVR